MIGNKGKTHKMPTKESIYATENQIQLRINSLLFSFPWGMNEKTDVHPAVQKCARRFFHSYLKETKKKKKKKRRKKSTVNSYNLISYHFHTKSKGKQP